MKGAFIGVAGNRLKDFFAEVLPDFEEQYRKAERREKRPAKRGSDGRRSLGNQPNRVSPIRKEGTAFLPPTASARRWEHTRAYFYRSGSRPKSPHQPFFRVDCPVAISDTALTCA